VTGSRARADIATIRSRLAGAADFVEVATAVCYLARECFDLAHCAMFLTTASCRPFIGVDTLELADDARLRYFCEIGSDPLFRELLATNTPVTDELVGRRQFMQLARASGYTGEDVFTLMVPLIRWEEIGAIRFGADTRFSAALRRDLVLLAQHAAARLAFLRVTIGDSPLDELTPTQGEVARLIGNDHDTRTIAEEMGVVIDTVKKHLKDIKDRTGLNRRELASLVHRVGPRCDVGPGVTHRGDVAVTIVRASVPVRAGARRA
jgi:DNA-binding CsgD family transcriptional regulator